MDLTGRGQNAHIARRTILLFVALFLTAGLFGGTTKLPAQVPSSAAGDAAECDPSLSSPFVSVDNWIYPEMLRLYSLGYVDSEFLGLRPWTRGNILQALDDTEDRIRDDVTDGDAGAQEALAIEGAVRKAIDPGGDGGCSRAVNARVESVYSIQRGLTGTPLRDSYHLGATIINDYDRPYEAGFNNYSGASGYGSAGHFLVYARGEFQRAPAAAGYSTALANELAYIDGTTDYYNSTTPIPLSQQTTIPAGPIASLVTGHVMEAYVSAQYLRHVISFGKQDAWMGPRLGGAFAISNNAESLYAFRIDRIEPLYIPVLSHLTGPFRYDFLVGPLKGHSYPISPWVHIEKISFRPTPNIEFGFERTVIWGGVNHEPVNVHSFLRSFFSTVNVTNAVKNSTTDPGARFGAFDFNYRLPRLRNWVTLYSDFEAHDDVSPIDAPQHASIAPGFFLSHVPRIPALDLRAEAVYTDPPNTGPNSAPLTQGRFEYWEEVQRDGYTNNGSVFGDWIGRDAKGGQAWVTYHLSGNEWVQVSFRHQKISQVFIPDGTTLDDINFQIVKRLGHDVELNATFTGEHYKAPIYLPGQQSATSTSVQLTWYPGWHVGF